VLTRFDAANDIGQADLLAAYWNAGHGRIPIDFKMVLAAIGSKSARHHLHPQPFRDERGFFGPFDLDRQLVL
jgi:hypothetical protein